MDFLSISWKNLHTSTFRVAQKIEHEKYHFDLIVAIARGGITIAHIFSDFLKLPVATFTISSYKDLQQTQVPEIKLKLGDKLHNKHILLVDDVSDTGKTFVRGIEYLKELGAESIKTTSLFTKPWTTFTPDYFDREVKEWIIFPYDMRETVEAISKMMKKEGKTKEEIIKRLLGFQIEKLFIEKYL